MALFDYIVDLDAQTIIVEWEREMLPEKPTRLSEIVPGDRITVFDLYGRNEATVKKLDDWGEDRGGIHVYLADGGIVTVHELVSAWTGCWLH